MDFRMIEIHGIWFVVAMSAIAAAVIIVGMRQHFETVRAKASIAREQAYQDLSVRAAEAQENTARQLERLATDTADLRDRVAAIEKMLREVE